MKTRVLFITLAPPENFCGVRLIMYRHLVKRNPFDLEVVTDADYAVDKTPYFKLKLHPILERLQKTRLHRWIIDYKNIIWPYLNNYQLDKIINQFHPDVILTVADPSLSILALKTAQKRRLPIIGLFLDLFPIMEGHYGHKWTQSWLINRFRDFYKVCDLAICTSEGMKEFLGPHANSHIVYPMPGELVAKDNPSVKRNNKFKLVYIGSVASFYGRMLCSLIEKFKPMQDLELLIIGPKADWPEDIKKYAQDNGIYLGFKPTEEAASILTEADALLVVMSFEKEHQLFMKTSFTTKFLDYCTFGKPIIIWGPDYCSPIRLCRSQGGAFIINQPEAELIPQACRDIANNNELRNRLISEAGNLHRTIFNPEKLQNIFVTEIDKLVPLQK